MPVITNIEDLRVLAKRRVPRMFYDYADSGSWTESTYRANEADFERILLRQRVAVNMEGRSTRTTMIGQDVAIYPFAYYASDGGLLAYGPNSIDQYRRAAGYVDHILKGEKPADLPVQQPTKYNLTINLKTAKMLGISVPLTLLAQADQVIE